MSKNRHNKKRNTAFLYEILIREATKAIVSQDEQQKNKVLAILKKNFNSNSVLAKELELYKALLETDDIEPYTAEKLLFQVREAHNQLNKDDVYIRQGQLINQINQTLSKGVYSNFVPNYKSLATISQFFNSDTSAHKVKTNVLLETKIIASLTASRSNEEQKKMQPIDNLIFKTFVEKFNDTYSNTFLKEQKELLNRYIFSFIDNGVDIKIYLNEELSRLHGLLKEALTDNEIKNDADMARSTQNVISMLESFKDLPIDIAMIKKVLKIQNLAQEIST